MAELTFKSAGVSLREIDLSGPTATGPAGIPAGVIGTSLRGPAFVPVTVGTFQDFISVFGNSDGQKFGPLAVREWLKNASAVTYVRVLGAGDGKTRTSAGVNPGNVSNAGFVVGSEQVQASGLVGANSYAGSRASQPGLLGRTYFLTAMMSETNGSEIFSKTGIQTSSTAVPIIRGILMAPSGVVLSLSASVSGVTNNTPATNTAAYGTFGAAGAGNAGANIGSVNLSNGRQEFTLLLNGLKNNENYSNIVTASFDPAAGNYFANLLNTDPTKIEQAGHYLYAHYDIAPSLAIVTGTGYGTSSLPNNNLFALLLTSTLARNTGSASSATQVGVPNFENFEDRFSPAFSPFVVSQKFGNGNLDLFKFYSITDGSAGSREFKITISNIQASTNSSYKYGTFDVLIRKIDDTDVSPVVLESFRGLTLDPTSDRYIAKVIGDTNRYFDFDQPVGKQRLVVEGNYPNVSQFVRVKLSNALESGEVDATALPTGFRGVWHLLTAANSVNGAGSILTGTIVSSYNVGSDPSSAEFAGITTGSIKSVKQPPIPMRKNISVGTTPRQIVQPSLSWGVQFEVIDDVSQPNKNQVVDSSVLSFCKYFPTFHTSHQNPLIGDNAGTADLGGAVLDSDRFNNNFFTLERIEVITGSNDRPDPAQWAVAQYRRDGVLSGSLENINSVWQTTRFLDAAKDFGHLPTKQYLKFTLPMQGGFDGLNIFNKDKSDLSNNSVVREMLDVTKQFGTSGPTVAAYRKAVDVLQNKTNADIQLLAIPGLRDPSVTDYAISAVENRFDALYIMDVVQKDDVSSVVTGSDQNISVTNTVLDLQSRGLNSSFAAAYFPDVVITDPATNTNIQCPPSVAVLGAFALNDAIGFPWFAPAGFTRGALSSVLEAQVKLNQNNLDALYNADINPITKFQGSSAPVIFGQKTLLAAQSALDRVNVRRLLIDVRRRVRAVANTFIFEPNRASTLAAFSAKVTPILATIQQQQGLDRFSVRIDTTTTTQADVENNTIRGKIFLQPTRSVEFISLDFVVTNAGAQI